MEIDSSSSQPTSLIDKIVVPGDVVLDLSSKTNQTIKLGAGLRQECDTLSAMEAGKLRFLKPNKYWVESSHKRYVPCVEDTILGIVVDSKPDNFLVDIKGPSLAFLPVLAFEGGTRRNIPKFEVGTLLYVRVVKANSGMNPELSCVDESLEKEVGRLRPIDAVVLSNVAICLLYKIAEKLFTEINTFPGKTAEFGLLKDGYMFETSTGLSRLLLSSPTCPVLEALGKKLSFEIAVGLNGRVWVNASSPSTVVLVSNAISSSEFLSGVQQRIMVEKLLQRVEQ